MLSYETVVTIGHILNTMAKSAGVIFTGAAGDEPAAILELYDFAKALGFEVVAAGKGKNNSFNRYATPESVTEEAKECGTSSKMHCSFVDGSKTMVEMTAVANATGLIPDIRGMHGPTVKLEELTKVFSLRKDGGILGKKGVVDFALGNIAPGVFVIITTDDPLIAEDLKFEKMGEGPNYLLYRPYHLCDIETPLSALLAKEFSESSHVPLDRPYAEVFPIAKKDLHPGDVLDGFGGVTCYSSMDEAQKVKSENLLPAGIAKGAIVITPIKKDTPITYDMVELPEKSILIHLRKLQDLFLEA
jgi:predicted homoserine dehydrogenase-like protein